MAISPDDTLFECMINNEPSRSTRQQPQQDSGNSSYSGVFQQMLNGTSLQIDQFNYYRSQACQHYIQKYIGGDSRNLLTVPHHH
ncbi:unnamed protein product [Ambrosiozyma monospora]|uniref:Unnamed protein product n=1 Tax=Ambrosiozyma monospora TaxID=43982 RepID=A0A9W6YM87_AMBMO|nr:unnamed protein product [Ambrosiozyma monospora]